MIYVKENGEIKEVVLTNKNIEKMRKKELFWIRCLFDSSFQVMKWDNDCKSWASISIHYARLGNAKNFIKRYKG